MFDITGNSPFEEGLIVVMDGMGETYKAMLEDIGGVEVNNVASFPHLGTSKYQLFNDVI